MKNLSEKKRVCFWEETHAFIASPEDIIIKKLSYYREGYSEKHLRDIRGILLNTEIDKEYLNKWLQELKLETEWKKAQ